MHVDERLARLGRLEQRVPARRHLAEAPADREHEVGVAQPCGDRLVHRDAEHADVARRAVVDEVLAAERTRDGKLVRLAERLHVAARLAPSSRPRRRRRAVARRRRAARAAARDRPARGSTDGGLDARCVGDIRLLGEHVLGEREDDRPGPAGQRERERLGHVLGNPGRAVDLPRGLRDPAEHLRVVELLPGLAAAKRARHLPDEEDHRRRVLLRRVHADRRLRRAWPARDEADARPAGELPVRLGRVGRALLVAAGDQADRRVVERVEHGQVALAGEAEREVDAVQLELVDEDPAAGPHSGTSRRTVARWSRGLSSSAGSR